MEKRRDLLRPCRAKSEGVESAQPQRSSGHATTSGASSPALSARPTRINYADRIQRLQALVGIRKIYRNLIRGERWLNLPEGFYRPLSEEEREELADDEVEPAVQERVEDALELIAEMAVTGEQLRMMRAVLDRNDALRVFEGRADTLAQIKARVKETHLGLAARVDRELQLASGALTKNEVKQAVMQKLGLQKPKSKGSEATSPMKRLEKAEKNVERFVSRTVKPYVEMAAETPGSTVKEAASWARDVWVRLNGGGRRAQTVTPRGLPLPSNSRAEVQEGLDDLALEIERLEKELQDASKRREGRLRSAGIESRALLATELRDLDARVMAVSRALAVRTLQLQLEYIFAALEEEALDITPESLWDNPQVPPVRMGTSDEVALLVAEYELLAEEIQELLPAADVTKDAGWAAAVARDDALARLAQEIPDMRIRLGINDGKVFGGPGPLSPRRLQLSFKESAGKVLEGVQFFSRGLRLMGSDLGAAGRVFMRAAMGGTLKPREVTALRRTARDMLSFVPFTIILLAPLTPVGHVLIFGFLQRYFPSFFPSQFSSRRQEIMTRYESLQNQLNEVQQEVAQEIQEKEFAAAAAAVARLKLASLEDGNDSDLSTSPSIMRLRQLERQVAEAAEESELGSLSDEEDRVQQGEGRKRRTRPGLQ